MSRHPGEGRDRSLPDVLFGSLRVGDLLEFWTDGEGYRATVIGRDNQGRPLVELAIAGQEQVVGEEHTWQREMNYPDQQFVLLGHCLEVNRVINPDGNDEVVPADPFFYGSFRAGFRAFWETREGGRDRIEVSPPLTYMRLSVPGPDDSTT